MEYYRTFYIVDALDRITLLVSLRITAAYEHHADCCTLIKLDAALVQVACCYTLKEIHDVALQAEHHALCLWITHTAVVLDDHRLAFNVDQTEEDESLIVDILLSKSFYCRTDDALVNLLHPLLGSEWYRGNATHTASVQTGIVLADALVILRLRKNLVVLAVCQYEYRALNATEEFLDDYACRSVAEHTAEHLLELFLSLFQGREDKNALTGAQTISLQYIRSLQCLQEFQAFLYVLAVESLILGSRDVVALHELLGEVLAAFQYGASL